MFLVKLRQMHIHISVCILVILVNDIFVVIESALSLIVLEILRIIDSGYLIILKSEKSIIKH